MFCVNDVCVSYVMMTVVGVVIVGVIVWMIRRKSDDELSLGGQPVESMKFHEYTSEQPAEDEDDENWDEDPITDESEYISAKKGDKLPFEDWVFEVTGIDYNSDRIFGNLIITLPPGAKFLSMTRQQAENYSAGVLGFIITIDPAGPALAETITYDPNPDDPPMHEDYEMYVEEILVYEADSTTS